MEYFPFEKVVRWIPFAVDHQEVENFVGNKLLYPTTIPQDWRELAFHQAFLCEKLRLERETSGEKIMDAPESLLVPPAITKLSPHLWQAVYLFLNSFEPEGVFRLLIKEDEKTENLGTCICFSGLSVKDEKIELKGNFGDGEKKIQATANTIFIVPTEAGEQFELSIKTNGLKLYGGNEQKIKVSGGKVGIVIDTRGRPLGLPFNDSAGRERINSWMQNFSKGGLG